MEDISSQSMSEAEVYWNCDSPTPTAWQRHQIPCSNDSRRKANVQDVHTKPLSHKRVKTTLFEVDMKSFDTARKLIMELGKQNYDMNSSLDSIFERSGNGEQLASVGTSELKSTCEVDIWGDEFLTDECLLQKLNEIQKAKPLASTSTPLRPAPKAKSKAASNANQHLSSDDLSTPEDCLEFFMSAGTQKTTGSPVLNHKTPKRKVEVANISITDEILSQLIMDDSWTQQCTKPSTNHKHKEETKKPETENCEGVFTGTNTTAQDLCVQKPLLLKQQTVSCQKNKSQSIKTQKKYQFVSKPVNSVLKTSNITKPPEKSTNGQKSNNYVISKCPNENLFSDDDEELLLQAVVLTESQKTTKTPPQKLKPLKNTQTKKCSAVEIERKKQEAIKRRLQRLKK